MHPEEDTELLRRFARAQDQDAFAELARRHLDLVYAAALRRMAGRNDLAADVAQQAFVTLARHARSLEKHPAVAGWLYVTTRHLAAAALRSERTRKLREEAHAMHASITAPGADPAWGEIRPHLDELIEQLDDIGRDAVVRRFFSNQKFAEMGVALRVSEDAARMRVERALDRMRTLLRRRGVTSTTAALGTLLATLPAGVAAPAGLAATVTTAAVAVAPLAASSAAIAALNFMNTTKAAGLTYGLAALVVAGGIYLTRQAGATEAMLHTVIQPQVTGATATPGAGTRRVGAIQSAQSGSGAPTVEPFVPLLMDPAEARALMERSRAISQEVKQNTTIISNRIRVRLRFHALYSILGLSRDEIERFEKLAAAKHISFGELIGTPEDQKVYLQGGLRTLDAVVTEAVGAQYAPAFRDYVATSALRSVAGELATNTYFTETPLTAAQAEQFVQACVACRGPNAVDSYIEPATVDWSAVLVRAEQFLAPGQMEALRAGLAKHLFDFEFARATGLPLRRPTHGL